MPAFELETELFDYYRKHAGKLGCKQCFDEKKDEIRAMNREGADGGPNCLCKVDTPCPCDDVEIDLLVDGICYCEIFVLDC